MSLHRKIIGWFVVFAALTIILFGLGDYVQSTRALRFALETRAGSLAQQLARDVERAYDHAEDELLTVGYAVMAGETQTLPPLAGRYMDVRVLRGDELLFAADALGLEQIGAAGCGTGDITFDVRRTAGDGVVHRITARKQAGHFFARVPSITGRMGNRGLTSVVETAGGALVFDAGCAVHAQPDPDGLAHALADRVVERADAAPGRIIISELRPGSPEERVLATVAATVPAWTAIVAVDYGEFAAPFVELRRRYFGVMGGALVLALLLVLTGIRHDMRRLAAISNAADAIGHGRFDVWLPPPTGDEVGRVSLALGRMMDRLSSTLRQVEVSRSMAAVGELATYLSHEIRNPLSSIRLNLQMLRRDLRGGRVPDDAEQLVELCLGELQRLDDVVRTVLEVGRTGAPATGTCDAHAVVDETLRVMQRKIAAKGVEVEVRLDAAETNVAMDSAALRSIVMNLVLNSVDALADSTEGRVRVTTQLLAGPEPCFELRVADNGPGVPAHLRERIFDPFFTTKATGNGIGLPTALRAVQQCAGVLRYEPSAEWGTGAEFVLELPRADAVGTADDSRIMVAAGA
jgi:signal transduction histidine kinase